MATKQEAATQGQQQAKEELIAQQVDFAVNNSFIDGLTKQLNSKCNMGLVFRLIIMWRML